MITAKEYLMRAYLLNGRIDTKVRQLDELNEMATHITATISDMPKVPSGETSRLENTVVKIIDLQAKINRKIDELVDLKAEIMSVIDEVPDITEREVLERRYINMEAWTDMATDLHFGLRRIYQIHGNALLSVEKVLKKLYPERVQ